MPKPKVGCCVGVFVNVQNCPNVFFLNSSPKRKSAARVAMLFHFFLFELTEFNFYFLSVYFILIFFAGTDSSRGNA